MANAADAKAIQEKKDEVQHERDKLLADLKNILAMPSGVRYFRELFARGMIFRTTFTGSSHTYFNEGARNFALSILSDVQDASPGMLVELLVKQEDGSNG